MVVYLDACCLNRPFDEQSQVRVCLEAQAVTLVLARVAAGEVALVTSDALAYEVARGRDPDRRARIAEALTAATRSVSVSPQQVMRAEELVRLGIHPYGCVASRVRRGGRRGCAADNGRPSGQ